jgi:hypothetical protein
MTPLGFPVDPLVYIAWLRWTQLCLFPKDGDALPVFAEFLDGGDGDVCVGSLDLLEDFWLRLPVVDCELESGSVWDDTREDREKLGIGENSRAFWLEGRKREDGRLVRSKEDESGTSIEDSRGQDKGQWTRHGNTKATARFARDDCRPGGRS